MVTPDGWRTPRFSATFFATAAIACFAYFALALLLMHALRPDRPLATSMISGYAVGRHGWVMTTAWLALSCGCLLLLLGLARSGPRSGTARLGALFLGILSIGTLITAIFPPDRPGAPSSRSGDIHDISFLVNVVSILLASGLLSAGFGSDGRWRAFQRTAVTLASLLVLAFVLQVLTLYERELYGFANRLFVTLLIVWLLTISIRLRALARE
jgi:hypothetical protein